ncbi:MAG TPA: YiiX/YebB-like N1pC/P60 family cysteine hydrolase [Candidatus Nanoarchaeia archaeon]|nr:YiiX/YebB-like N1pC/P60 family cysteine hydrolase [Candidatus Nanoarchaeia archaeon]
MRNLYALLNNPVEIFNQFEPGDVILTRERGLKHGIDRVFQRSWWNHVLLYVGDGKVLDASPLKGCTIFSLKPMREKYEAWRVVRPTNLTRQQRRAVAALAVQHFLGKPFSWLQVLGILLFRNFRLRKWQAPFLPGNDFTPTLRNPICSNIPSLAYFAKGVVVNEYYPPAYIVPKDYIQPKGFRVVFENRWE